MESPVTTASVVHANKHCHIFTLSFRSVQQQAVQRSICTSLSPFHSHCPPPPILPLSHSITLPALHLYSLPSVLLLSNHRPASLFRMAPPPCCSLLTVQFVQRGSWDIQAECRAENRCDDDESCNLVANLLSIIFYYLFLEMMKILH